MKSFLARMNPLVRGLALVALIALVVVVLNLGNTVAALFLIAKIAFPLAIAYFLFMIWRERRSDIETWTDRERRVFYAAVAVGVVAALAYTYASLLGVALAGFTALALVVTLALCGWSAYRAWRDAHTYGS
jgi:small-conductance mechanosensitive channel